MNRLISYLFFCTHEHVTWPIARKRGQAWQSCLDCGKRRPVSFEISASRVIYGTWVSDVITHVPEKKTSQMEANHHHGTVLERG